MRRTIRKTQYFIRKTLLRGCNTAPRLLQRNRNRQLSADFRRELRKLQVDGSPTATTAFGPPG
jgi:hypothetical protein